MVIPKVRTLLFIAFAGAFVFWLRFGEEVLSGHNRDSTSRIIETYREEVERQNPETANWIEQKAAAYGDQVLAASIRAERGSLSSFEVQQQSIQNRARLIHIFQRDPLRDDAILWSHGTSLAVVDGPDPENRAMTDQWLQRLETAQADPAIWSLVRDNPIAMSSDLMFTDKLAREFYAAHGHWVDDLVTALMQTVDDAPPSSEAELSDLANAAETSPADSAGHSESKTLPTTVQVDTVLKVAMAAQPYLKNALPDPAADPISAAVVFLTFAEHGPLLNDVCRQNVPPSETVEVLLLNADVLAADVATTDTAQTAARLVRLYRDKKRVWDQARREPLVLRFDLSAPKFSQSLIERFPQHGVPSLVVTQYPDAASSAAAAIDRYGELAIAVLVHYAPSDRFRTLLADDQLGYRTVMVAAMEGDVGLEKLASDHRHLSKLVDETGTPRKADWWQSVPVIGGIANVARNVATDRPSDWSELGWAAWDVVDAALIVGSLGTSKLATEVGKQGLKATARIVGREAASNASVRTVAATSIRTPSLLEAITTTSGRSASRSATRLATSAGGADIAAAAARTSRLSATLRIGNRSVALITRPMLAISAKALQATRVVFAATASVPPAIRLWVTRGLLGISLMARTPQMAMAMVDSISDFTGNVVDEMSSRVNEIKSMIGLPIGGEGAISQGIQRAVYFIILTLLATVAIWILIRPRRQSRHWLGRLGF